MSQTQISSRRILIPSPSSLGELVSISCRKVLPIDSFDFRIGPFPRLPRKTLSMFALNLLRTLLELYFQFPLSIFAFDVTCLTLIVTFPLRIGLRPHPIKKILLTLSLHGSFSRYLSIFHSCPRKEGLLPFSFPLWSSLFVYPSCFKFQSLWFYPNLCPRLNTSRMSCI